ncbi:MAG TPA: hypothetical protein VN541_15400 [Tepidisphaeraceae bacterium]|nr:hypothetical protein [Tepidisphaeraceae bacterium]
MIAVKRLRGALGIMPGPVILAACIMALMVTGCKRDVTTNSTYGFSAVAGTWKTKVPLTVARFDKDAQFSPYRQSGLQLELLTNDYAKAFVGIPHVTFSTLPVGTEIRIEHLIADSSTEAGTLYWCTGSLTYGPYGGQPLILDPHLFAPNAYLRNYFSAAPLRGQLPHTWAVDSSALGK